MAIETPHKSSVTVKLDAGVNPVTGNTIVRSCSLSKIVSAAPAAKVLAVVGALLPCLLHSLIRVERSEISVLEN
jgi:hypothetical protein